MYRNLFFSNNITGCWKSLKIITWFTEMNIFNHDIIFINNLFYFLKHFLYQFLSVFLLKKNYSPLKNFQLSLLLRIDLGGEKKKRKELKLTILITKYFGRECWLSWLISYLKEIDISGEIEKLQDAPKDKKQHILSPQISTNWVS